MTQFRRLLACLLVSSLAACTKAELDPADSEPVRLDQDPWERVGATIAKKPVPAVPAR